MQIIDAIDRIEGAFKCITGEPIYKAPNGERYVTIVSGGEKPEGESLPAVFSTPELAVDHWLAAVHNYARNKSNILYWRTKPQLESINLTTDDGRIEKWWTVYARLLVEGKGS